MSERVETSNTNAVDVDRLVMPHAGHFNDEGAYNCETEKLDKRKVKVKCPKCERVGAPLCSNKTELIRGYFLGFDDWGDRHTLFKTECRCGQQYRFTVVSDC